MVATGDDLEDGGRLGGRPPGHPIEAPLVSRAELACALGDVEDDGGGSAIELVLEVSTTRGHLVEDLVHEVEELHGSLVNVESVVIEHRDGLIGRASERVARQGSTER